MPRDHVEIDALVHDTAARRLSRALSLYVGMGRDYSVDALADATGIKPRTIYAYLAGDATPGLFMLLRLCAALPPAFTNMLLEPAGLTGAHRADGAARPAPEILSALLANACALQVSFKHERVDHRNAAAIKRALGELVGDLQRFLPMLNQMEDAA